MCHDIRLVSFLEIAVSVELSFLYGPSVCFRFLKESFPKLLLQNINVCQIVKSFNIQII